MSTIEDLDKSQDSADPILLFRFSQDVNVWAMTNCEDPVVYNGDTYAAVAVDHEPLTDGSTKDVAQLVVHVPANSVIAQEVIPGLQPSAIAVSVFYRHRDSSDTDVVFIGTVSSLTTDGSMVKLVCSSVQSSLTQSLPRTAINLRCPWQVFDNHCRLTETDFDDNGTISAVSGLDYTLTGLPFTISPGVDIDPTHWQGGYLEFEGYRAFIQKQVGQVFTLMSPLPGAGVGTVVRAVPGCDKTQTTCFARFNNRDNFGGLPALPGRDPFVVGLN